MAMKFLFKNISDFDRDLFIYGVFFMALLTLEPLSLVHVYEKSNLTFVLLGYFMVCLFLGFGFINIILRFAHGLYIPVMGFTFMFGLFSLKFSFYSFLLRLDEIPFAILMVLAFLLATFLLYFFKRHRVEIKGKFYVVAVIVGLISPVQLVFFSGIETEVHESIIERESRIEGEIIPDFKDKPNIYVLGYESLASASPTVEKLGLDELPYQAVLDERFYNLDYGMSFHIQTRSSIGNVMRLGQRGVPKDYKSFSGSSSSYLERILHSNGYHVVTGHLGYYLGRPGPFVDETLIPADRVLLDHTTLCLARQKFERLQAFLACDILGKWIKPLLLGDYNFSSGFKEYSFHGYLVETIKKNVSRESPVFTFAFYLSPIGHTSKTYDHDNLAERTRYRDYFVKGGFLFRDQISETMDVILAEDPSSLVLVLGDHGPFLSERISVSDDPEFYYRGGHGVIVAVGKTEHPCAEAFRDYRLDTYNTAARVLVEMFSCLSGGDFPLEDSSFDEDEEIAKYILSGR